MLSPCEKHWFSQKKTEGGLFYADVFTTKQNEVPEPSSFEPTKYSAVEHQFPNEVQDCGSMQVEAAIS